MRVEAGERFCEHHDIDLAAFAKNPGACVKITQSRFPKRHHPACDRKGENDCDCHNFSRGAHGVMALKKAFEQSKLLSSLYKRHLKVIMDDKVKRIRKYYRSLNASDLTLPKNSNFRQFRFFCWDRKTQRIVVRVLKDCIRNEEILLSHLKRLAPLHVYYTTAIWLNPQGIGPDPKSRRADNKFKKKNWRLREYHNTLLKRDLYFDVDYDNKDYDEGIKMVQEVINTMLDLELEDYILPRLTIDDFEIVFSGGKGFHVIVNGYYDKIKVGDISFTEFVNTPEKNALVEEFYLNLTESVKENENLLLDWMVTYDNRRIIRLPGSVHGKTMRVCTKLTGVNDPRILKNNGDFIGYLADEEIP